MPNRFKNNSVFLLVISLLLGCGKDSAEEITEALPEASTPCSQEGLLEFFTDPEGNRIFIYGNGETFLEKDGKCQFELQYFDPSFIETNYETNASGTFLLDDGDLIAIKNDFLEDFESKNDFKDLFALEATDPDLFWTNLTLQSPQAKSVSEYVALSQCLLAGACDFLDNRVDMVPDPSDGENLVVQFTSEAPTLDMVTAKCSLSSLLTYFEKGSDIWYEADYFIVEGMPYSIVDFESSFFEFSPGPRVVISGGKLAFNNKFGAKNQYESNSDTTVPVGEWFTVKVHLRFSNTQDGILELWQNGEQLIGTTGINLQTSNALQNILEVGISATSDATTLLMDNIRISNSAF